MVPRTAIAFATCVACVSQPALCQSVILVAAPPYAPGIGSFAEVTARANSEIHTFPINQRATAQTAVNGVVTSSDVTGAFGSAGFRMECALNRSLGMVPCNTSGYADATFQVLQPTYAVLSFRAVGTRGTAMFSLQAVSGLRRFTEAGTEVPVWSFVSTLPPDTGPVEYAFGPRCAELLVPGVYDSWIGWGATRTTQTVEPYSFSLQGDMEILFLDSPEPTVLRQPSDSWACHLWPGATTAEFVFTAPLIASFTWQYRSSDEDNWASLPGMFTLAEGLVITMDIESDAAHSRIEARLEQPFDPMNGPGGSFQVRCVAITACGLQIVSEPASMVYCCCGYRCLPDFNASGALTVQDIFDFLAAYFALQPGGDFNHVNGHTVQDIFDYLAAYFLGCL